MTAEQKYQEWLAFPELDEEIRQQLEDMKDHEDLIQECFYKELEFGTAGLRGIIGAGTNRMNLYTIRKATQGMANYIRLQQGEKRGVVIAFDSRHMSPEFALEAALCLCGNGIRVYLFESLRPTPELSFGVRQLNAIAGINITASHNPAAYNGYKVYWEDGAQITPPNDRGIMEQVVQVTDFNQMKTMTREEAVEQGLLTMIGERIDRLYLDAVEKMSIHPEVIAGVSDQIRIVYTPLHGAGNIPVRTVLKEMGFTQVYVVEEQEKPDGSFKTVNYPNPETEKAFELGLKLAGKVDAELILATDPDADRLGVYVRDWETKEYHPLTGNMSGCLLAEYCLAEKSKKEKLPSDGIMVKSIVTTNLATAIAREHQVKMVEVLTGFKYIGQKILECETEHTGTYLFGMEESYGCLPGTYARDKDAVVASMLLCEAAAYYKTKGKSLWQAMLDLYQKHGYYREEVLSQTLEGRAGLEKIKSIMEELRVHVPEQIGNHKVRKVRDYEKGIIYHREDGTKSPTGLPESNVLYYELDQDAWVCVRPSGTEPKIKVYFGVKGSSPADADKQQKSVENGIKSMLSME